VKVGVFADTHVGRSIPNVIAEQRRRAFRHAFTQAVDAFIREGVDYAIHAGDLFERRSMTPSDSLFVKEELQRLVDSLGKVKIFVVRGNHDGTAENSALNYVEHPLAKYLTVVGEGTLRGEPELCEEGGFALVGFGYTPYASARLEQAKEAVRAKLENAKARHKIFLAHMFVEGHEAPGAPEYQVAPISLVKELGADLVVAGHHHKRALMEVGGFTLLVPGATEAIDLADEGPHGVWILNLDGKAECRFIPLKPLHKIRSEAVDTRGAAEKPEWFVERAVEAARSFADELRSEGAEGILRIAMRGTVDGNKFDLQAEVEGRMREIRAETPLLLHVEVDNGLKELSAGEASVPEHVGREEFLREAFSVLGDEGLRKAMALAEEVQAALEERASAQTGLLKESDRKPYVERWIRILEEHAVDS